MSKPAPEITYLVEIETVLWPRLPDSPLLSNRADFHVAGTYTSMALSAEQVLTSFSYQSHQVGAVIVPFPDFRL